MQKLKILPNTEDDTYFSKTNNYYFKVVNYAQDIQILEPTSNISGHLFLYKIQIFDNKTKENIFSFVSELSPHESFAWLLIDNIEYLFYPEFKTGCQSIFDTSTLKLNSFYDVNSENQFFKLIPSPNSLFLAVQYANEVQILSVQNCPTIPFTIVNRKKLLTPYTNNPTEAFEGYFWSENELTITYKERIYTPAAYLLIEIISVEDNGFIEFSFQDINGKQYHGNEKQEWFLLEKYLDKNSEFPIKNHLQVIIRNFKTIDGNKIYCIIADQIRNAKEEYIEIEVNECQLIMNS